MEGPGAQRRGQRDGKGGRPSHVQSVRRDFPGVRQNEQAIDTVQLGIIAQLQADRNKRTLQSQESISPVIWSAAIINGFIVVSMSFLLYADRTWPHIVMSGALAAMISALLCVVFILVRPFGGLMPLQPDAFAHFAGGSMIRWTEPAEQPLPATATPHVDTQGPSS